MTNAPKDDLGKMVGEVSKPGEIFWQGNRRFGVNRFTGGSVELPTKNYGVECARPADIFRAPVEKLPE